MKSIAQGFDEDKLVIGLAFLQLNFIYFLLNTAEFCHSHLLNPSTLSDGFHTMNMTSVLPKSGVLGDKMPLASTTDYRTWHFTTRVGWGVSYTIKESDTFSRQKYRMVVATSKSYLGHNTPPILC